MTTINNCQTSGDKEMQIVIETHHKTLYIQIANKENYFKFGKKICI